MPLPRDTNGKPESRIVRQLCEALLYEGLVDHTVTRRGRGCRFEWSDGHVRCDGHLGAFGRVRLDGDSIVITTGDGWRSASLGDILATLDADPARLSQLELELGQTLGFASWNAENLEPRDRRGLRYRHLDAAIDEGHPYHPCFKARTGFSFDDHAAFGPEAGRQFQLCWLAVSPDHLKCALPETEDDFWRREIGLDAWSALRDRKVEAGVAGHGLVPVHPWQWRMLCDSALSTWIDDGTAVFLGPAGDDYRASQSVRTVFNHSRPERAAVKLPMNLVNSSAMRILDPHTVCTAPFLSRWLQSITAEDSFLSGDGRLILLGEYAGIVADRDGPLAGQIAAIWRDNVQGRIEADEQATPLNALMMVEGDGRPFIADWIERHGVGRWIDRLVDVVVLPVFHLLLAHGIATEAHGQNLILVHRDGWPTGLAMQDFHDSVEYVPGFLADPNLVPDFGAIEPALRLAGPNESYWMESVDLLSDLFVDALFVYNLAEISHLLHHAYGIDENVFWHSVSQRMVTHARSRGLTRRLAELGLFKPHMRAESLLARKLRPTGAPCEHIIPNSLAAAADMRRTA